jgi:hypothetical protein
MTQPESRLTRKIMQTLLEEQGIFCFKVHGNIYMYSGLPDLICCIDGRFLGLEVKVPGRANRVTPRQRHVGDLITEAGGEWSVVSSVDQALDVVERLRGHSS